MYLQAKRGGPCPRSWVVPSHIESLAPVLLAEGFGVALVTLADDTGEGAALKQTTGQTRFVQTRFTVELAKPRETYLLALSRGAHTMQKLLETSPVRYSGPMELVNGILFSLAVHTTGVNGLIDAGYVTGLA